MPLDISGLYGNNCHDQNQRKQFKTHDTLKINQLYTLSCSLKRKADHLVFSNLEKNEQLKTLSHYCQKIKSYTDKILYCKLIA